MVKGTGYQTIYISNFEKYTMSATTLKHIIKKDGKQRERLYVKVTNIKEINEIEDKSMRWKQLSNSTSGYYIHLQENAWKEKTGYIKIVEKTKVISGGFFRNVEANKLDWIYFKKRNIQ